MKVLIMNVYFEFEVKKKVKRMNKKNSKEEIILETWMLDL
jgi:hypothetical protein